MSAINKYNGGLYMVQTGFLAMVMFTLAILTIFGNTVVIYALRTNRHLRTVMFCDSFFVVSVDKN
jgi:hypothetical protein